MGHRVQFYVPRYSAKDFSVVNLPPVEPELGAGIGIFRLPSLPYPPAPTRQGRFVLPVLSSLLHIRKFNPDIIYTQDFFSAGIEALVVSKILRKPLVGTSHTPVSEFLKYSPFRSGWMNKLILKYVSWYYNRCSWITAPCRAILTEMEEFGFRKSGMPLSNPIRLDEFQPVPGAEKKALKTMFGLSSKTILYAGRLAEEKHIDEIIHAVAIVRESIPDITLACTGHGNAESSLKQLVRTLHLEENVFFFGFLETQTFIQLYQASDLFTVMSTAETQCMSMIQAMTVGLPVIGANAGGLPEYINSECGFIVEPGDFRTLAQEIIRLFQNPREMERLGQGGYTYSKSFSANKIAEKWQELFLHELSGVESISGG